MLSVIIPSRNEQFLQKTISDVLKKAEGEIEIIVTLDGYWTNPPLEDDSRLKIIHFGKSRGMRPAINAAVTIAQGEYIMKLDAHCMVGNGFDKILTESCEDNFIIVPRRRRLDAESWAIEHTTRPDIDYMYLAYLERGATAELKGVRWEERNKDESLMKILIDDLMSFQGSCYFMKRDYFYKLDLLDDKQYGTSGKEAQEVGLKCWLSDGQVKVNKNTWYAHLHKGSKYGLGYSLDDGVRKKSSQHSIKWMKFREAWHKQTKPMSWLIERFSPVPTWENIGERLNDQIKG